VERVRRQRRGLGYPLSMQESQIKVLKRVAYGYRDLEFFTLRLLFLHETKVEMAGA